MSHKHTPGPWHLEVGEDGPPVVKDDNGEFVTYLSETRYHDGRHDQEAEANARLIAAAPQTAAERDRLREVNAELLAALKAMFRAAELRDMDNCDIRSPHVAVEWFAANQAARRAIVNAEAA